MRFWSGLATMALSVSLLAACGGGSSGSKTAQLRLLNASVGYPSLDLSVNSTVQNAAVAYGAAGSYANVTTDAITTAITVAGSSNTLSSSSRSLTKDTHYTLVGYGWQGALKTALVQEDVAAADANKAKLMVLNLAVDAGSVDVYLTGNTDALADASAVTSNVPGGAGSAYTVVGSGTYRLRVTGANDKDDLRLDVTGVALDSTKVAVLALTSGPGGVLVNGVLLPQQAASSTLANTLARVRVVAAVSGNGTVTANVNGTALASGVTSPYVPLKYSQIAAGTNQTVVVGVNGVAVAVPNQTLAAGSDYTLLVSGNSASPSVNLVSDDNRLPTLSTNAKIRIINGLSGVATPLNLAVDFSPVAVNVVQGSASSFISIAANASAQLDVTSPLPAFTAIKQTAVSLTAKNLYTVFLFGDVSPAMVLRKER